MMDDQNEPLILHDKLLHLLLLGDYFQREWAKITQEQQA